MAGTTEDHCERQLLKTVLTWFGSAQGHRLDTAAEVRTRIPMVLPPDGACITTTPGRKPAGGRYRYPWRRDGRFRADAQKGILDGEFIKVKSRRGEVGQSLCDPRGSRGLVWMAFHFREECQLADKSGIRPGNGDGGYKRARWRLKKYQKVS